jgi:RNA polymerase sigma factor (sigma-70 family)
MSAHGCAPHAYLAANYHRLQRRLTHHLGCPELARESLHDAWLRLVEKDAEQSERTAPPAQNAEAYVYRVACNAAIDRLRGNRSRQYDSDAEMEVEQIADQSPGPDVIADARCGLQAMSRAMQQLPRLHSAVLLALRVDELPRQEVAKRYGLSLRGVDTALRKALMACHVAGH